MTAWIWLYDAKDDSPYDSEGKTYRFEVPSVARAREMVAALYPAAPPLAARVVLDCEYGECRRRDLIPEKYADTVERVRELMGDPRAFRGGWYQGLYRGRMSDICQLHYEICPDTGMTQPVGTQAAKRQAAEVSTGGGQLDLFASAR
ncbi:hypothetical protein AB0F88_17185 [Streptosporangium sp. NPDC023963]|uniref:hypothetical protein n=1 Tax=Streptosporangium sp. NPDC023963 TaxID=3155608 RepID=UPI00342C0354